MIFKQKGISMSDNTMARGRSKSLVNMPNLRDIALDSSLVMLAFLNNTDTHLNRVRFNEPLSSTFREDIIPKPLLDLLRYMSDEGVTVPDVFRRPGNTAEQKKLIKKLSEGKQIIFSDYNFYTLASVIKRFLLSIPGGIFGQELEEKALTVTYLENRHQQLEGLNKIIGFLPRAVQRFITLLFGVWYRIADMHHLHKMTAEAMAKSVTGSIFLNSTGDPRLVNTAAKVMQIMIENFPNPTLFGNENLEFFCGVTCCSLGEQTKGNSLGGTTHSVLKHDMSSPNLGCTQTRTNLDTIKNRQLDRLKQRADWFLNPKSAESSPRLSTGRRARAYVHRQTIACVPTHQSDDDSETSSEEEQNNECIQRRRDADSKFFY